MSALAALAISFSALKSTPTRFSAPVLFLSFGGQMLEPSLIRFVINMSLSMLKLLVRFAAPETFQKIPWKPFCPVSRIFFEKIPSCRMPTIAK
jgi:hypothetical protein